MYHQLKIRQFKDDIFNCLNLLYRGRDSTGILSVLNCSSSVLFIVKMYKIILYNS